MQQAVNHPDWGVRNNPEAEHNVARLLAHWRAKRWPLIHVRHDSTEANSHYRPGQALHAFRPQALPLAGGRRLLHLWANGLGRKIRNAEEVHAMSLANLDGEYCTVTRTDNLL
ncbi:MAG TPA: hypothetical protein VMO78_19070 [Rhizomicrobium sp.]|nr:hypothetical protein [Rhizomicrobium sp.]